MRTTITLSDDLHEILLSIARDRRLTLSSTIEEIIAGCLRQPAPGGKSGVRRSRKTGLPVVRVGRPVTAADVRAMDDE